MKLIGNNVFLLIVRSLSKLITFVVIAFLARELGADNFGVYGTIITLVSFAGIISDFGLILPAIRSISRQEIAPSVLANGMVSTRIFWSCLGFLFVVVLSTMFQLPLAIIVIFAISAIFEITSTNLIRLYEGIESFKVISVFGVIERLFFALAVIGAIGYEKNLLSIAVGYVVSYSVLLVLSVRYFSRDFGALHVTFSWSSVKKYSLLGFPFFIILLFSAIYNRSDLLLINYLCGNIESGLFNAAIKIFEAQSFIPMTLMVTVYPNLANKYKESISTFKSDLFRAGALMTATGIVFSIIVFSYADSIIYLLYTNQYHGSIEILRILSLMFVFYYLNAVLGFSLFAMHQEKVYARLIIGFALLNICANWYLLPMYGIIASVYIRIGEEILLFTSMIVLIYWSNYFQGTN
jgi:O-antigen/teichoic acid export membrane protein